MGSNYREESSVDVGVQEDVGGTVAAGQTEKFEINLKSESDGYIGNLNDLYVKLFKPNAQLLRIFLWSKSQRSAQTIGTGCKTV